MVTTDYNLGLISESPVSRSTFLNDYYTDDAYSFSINNTQSINLNLHNITDDDDADLYLYRDDGDGVFELGSDQELANSRFGGNADDSINYLAEAGDYFARVERYASGSIGRLDYELDLSATPTSPYPPDDPFQAPNLLPHEVELGTVFNDDVSYGQLGRGNTVDTYSFSVLPGDELDIELEGLTNDVDLRLVRDSNRNQIVDSGEVINYSAAGGNNSEEIKLEGLFGDFFLQVYMYGDGDPNPSSYTDTDYTLRFEHDIIPIDASWTFMVYLDGDNDLEGAAITDFLEMSSVGSSAEVNIVTQLDRISDYDPIYGDWTDTRFGNWTDTRVGLIEQGDEPDLNWGTSIGEVNMGDGDTLSDFIDWAISDYPADNYALVLWDHGGGWPGVCSDDSSGGDGLETSEVGDVLSNFDENFDFLGIDACLMGMVEFAYEVRDDASVFVASEELIPGSGWDYENLLRDLTEDADMDAEELGVIAVNRYGAQFDTGSDNTLSAIDLTGMNALSANLDQLTGTIMSDATLHDVNRLEVVRSQSPTTAFGTTWNNPSGTPEYRDLGALLSRVTHDSSISDSIRNDAEDALDSYDDLIIHNYSGDSRGTGLSIHFPNQGLDIDSNYNSLAFADETQWDEFLGWWSDPYVYGVDNDMSIV